MYKKTVVVFAFLFSFTSVADLLFLSSNRSYLIKFSSSIHQELMISGCLRSVPAELLVDQPSKYCSEYEKIIQFDDVLEIATLGLSSSDMEILEREVEASGFSKNSTELKARILHEISSSFTRVLDLRNSPILKKVSHGIFGILPDHTREKSGIFRASFSKKRSLKMSRDGNAIYYVVNDTVVGFDLWSEQPNLDYKILPRKSRGACDSQADIQPHIYDHQLSPDGRYLIILVGGGGYRLEVYNRVEQKMLSRIEIEDLKNTRVDGILGFPPKGDVVAFKGYRNRNAIYFIDFEALTRGEFLDGKEPELGNGDLKDSIFGCSHTDDGLLRNLGRFEHNLGNRFDGMFVSPDGTTKLVWRGGDYFVSREAPPKNN